MEALRSIENTWKQQGNISETLRLQSSVKRPDRRPVGLDLNVAVLNPRDLPLSS